MSESKAGGPADDVTVRQFKDKVAEFVAAVVARDFVSAIRQGGSILSVAADLFGLSFLTSASATACGPDEEADLAASEAELEKCKQSVDGLTGADPDKAKIDPATILMIIQLVMSLIDAIRKRRNPPVPTP